MIPHSTFETGQQSPNPSPLAQSSRLSPHHGSNGEARAAKAARVEVAAPQGFIPPPIIDEVTEPE